MHKIVNYKLFGHKIGNSFAMVPKQNAFAIHNNQMNENSKFNSGCLKSYEALTLVQLNRKDLTFVGFIYY